MMKKRKTSIKTLAAKTAMTLALMLLTTATAWAAVGDVVDSGTCGDNLTWTLTENEDNAVTWANGTTGHTAYTLTITGSGAMTDFTSSTQPWKDNKQSVTRLVLPDGLTTVGDYAFDSFFNVTSVTLPAAVTSIGTSAFYGGGNKTSSGSTFTAAEGSLLSSIGTDAFQNYGGDVDLRNCTSLTTIGADVFKRYRTKTLYLPVSMRTVAANAIYPISTTTSDKPKVRVAYDNSVVSVNGTYRASSTGTGNALITSAFNIQKESSAAVSISQIRFDDIALTWDSTDKYFAIADEQDLIDLAEYVRGGDDHGCEGVTFKMTADLDFTNMPDNYHDKNGNGSGNFLPIGLDVGTLFKGHFDGDGHTITGLRFDYPATHVGLFRAIASAYAVVEGVTLVSPNFSAYNDVGGIAGGLQQGIVRNCAVVGGTLSVSNEGVGGIVGFSNYYNSSSIKSISGCTVVATTLSGTEDVGIIVGSNSGTTDANAALTISGCTYHNPAGLDVCGYGSGIGYTDGGGNKCVYQASLADGLTAATAAYSHGHDYYFANGDAVTLGHGDRTGYDFGGYESSDVTISEGAFEMPASDVTVGATWTLHDYTITYDLAGGTADNVTTYNIESDAITLTNPTRTGYDFAGWTGTDLDDATETVTIDHGSTGDRSYTATWTASDNIALTANLADGNYWTTFYCGDADYTITTDGAYAYTATVGTDEVTLTKRGADIPKGKAVIIVGGGNGSDASVSISLSKTNGLAAYGGTNDLQGVDVRTKRTDIDASATFYVMGNKSEGFGFYAYTAEYVPARKAYFTVPASSSAPARGFTMVFGSDETGITTTTLTDGTMADDAWYTMDGRRLQGKPATKGMYINGGKKIVIK